MQASQLGDGAAEEEVDPDASQRADGWQAQVASQPAQDGSDAAGPRAEFARLSAGLHDSPPSFRLAVERGAKLYLGRLGGEQFLLEADRRRFVKLTDQDHTGLSRSHGWVEFDQHEGVKLVPCQKAGFPTFINHVPLAPDAAPVVLNDGDEVGFGGSDCTKETEGTIRYEIRLVEVPEPVPRMPPPPARAEKRSREQLEAPEAASAAQEEAQEEAGAGGAALPERDVPHRFPIPP